MNKERIKELIFKVIDIDPRYIFNDIFADVYYHWIIGEYNIEITETGEKTLSFSISITPNISIINYSLDNLLSDKEIYQIKLRLIELKENFESRVMDELLHLTGTATLNNQFEELLPKDGEE